MAPPDTFLSGGGEMGALMRATDWSKTKLGPVELWPQSLRTMLGVILGSRFPMLVWWGPDLLHLYNDAYRPILRDKHPASLAAPAAEVWAEVWDVVKSMAERVLAGGPASWTEDLQLFINSGKMAEETYFTFSYSPIPGDDGRVGGILNTVQETTAKVQGERQIRLLHELAARAADAKSEEDACRIALEVLATDDLDLPFALIYLAGENDARLAGGWETYTGRARPARVPLASTDSWPLGEAIRSAQEAEVDGLAARFGNLPAGRWGAAPERAILLPLLRAGQAAPFGVLVAGVSPHRALDDRYRRFFRAAADQAMTVIANAGAWEAERKRAEALAELDEAKTAFFANVSHEFRTPLTLMLGPLEEALSDPATPATGPQRERLELAHDNALRLLKLVNALLEFSRLEAGRMRANFAPLDFGRVTAELAAMFQSAVTRAGLRFVVDCPPSSEPAFLDRDLWEKIVPNLVSNAFKFTRSGEIAVHTFEENGRFVLTVRDTGCGIPENELPRIFERFHRVAGVNGRTHEGSGIGLALVRQLAEVHGGAVTVRSEVGKGTTFRVAIPKGSAHLPPDRVSPDAADPSRSRDPEAFAREAARWSGIEPVAAPAPPAAGSAGTRPRVLVIDDNADMREYFRSLLSPLFELELAVDGRAGIEAIRARRPDVVVSDVMMPRLTGVGMVRELRADASLSSLPVILLSARAGEEASVEGIDAGADDYLVKPFSARELVARVRMQVTLAHARREWTLELERINQELDAFSYSVSHDLRAPLRAVAGFAGMLVEDYGASLDETARGYLARIVGGTVNMERLIDDLIGLARVSRGVLAHERVDLSELASSVVDELRRAEPSRETAVEICGGLLAWGDRRLFRVALVNLIGNAWKFTSKTGHGRIEIGTHAEAFFVRDNGAGFDPAYAARLFSPFQRLHSANEFEGTGIGLATVHRVISRHHGRVWAEGAVGKGATFWFSVPRPSARV